MTKCYLSKALLTAQYSESCLIILISVCALTFLWQYCEISSLWVLKMWTHGYYFKKYWLTFKLIVQQTCTLNKKLVYCEDQWLYSKWKASWFYSWDKWISMTTVNGRYLGFTHETSEYQWLYSKRKASWFYSWDKWISMTLQ